MGYRSHTCRFAHHCVGVDVLTLALGETDELQAGSDERFAVGAALEPDLRLYRRLWLSRIDLEEARDVASELLMRKIPVPRTKPMSGVLLALNTALVVSYARPFVSSRGTSLADKALPGSLLRDFSSDEREFHEVLIHLRNKEVAHTDADLLELTIEVFKDGDGGIFRPTRHPFRRPALHALHRMILKVDRAIQARCEELRDRLPHNVWL